MFESAKRSLASGGQLQGALAVDWVLLIHRLGDATVIKPSSPAAARVIRLRANGPALSTQVG